MFGNRRMELFGRRKLDKALPLILGLQMTMLIVLYVVDMVYVAKLAAAHKEVELIGKRLAKMADQFETFLQQGGFQPTQKS